MFLWKSAIVILGLLGVATMMVTSMSRVRWERTYVTRLALAGAALSCAALSFVPMSLTQAFYALMMLLCFDRRVPMVATYLFFLFWTPAAGTLFGLAGAYIATITPFMSFAFALIAGYMLHPTAQLRRGFGRSDAYMLAFALIYCICTSLRESPTGTMRNIAIYFVPYVGTYFILSRLRITRPELVLRWMLFGAAAAALICIFETIRQWPLYSGIMQVKNDMWLIDAVRIWLNRGGIVRAYGPFAHPLVGGAMLSIAVIGAWGLWLMRGRSTQLMGLTAIVLIGTASTLSRSGVVALAVGMTVFQFLRRRYVTASLPPLAGLVVLFGLPVLGGIDAQLSTEYRMRLITGIPAALGSRVWLGYREAVREGLLDDFFQGQGIVDLVNTYLALIVQGGIISLIPYLLFLFSGVSQYRKIRKMKPDRDYLLFAQTLVSMLGATIVGLVLLSSWTALMQLSFILVALLVATRAEVAQAKKMALPPREPLVATAPVESGERLPALR